MKFIISIFIGVILSFSTMYPCTNLLVTKGASKQNANMITYAADAGGFMEPLTFLPSKDYKAGEMMDIFDWDSEKYLGKIPQALHTYQVVGNINEWQLSIGETTYTRWESARDSNGLIDYGSLMYITLQRCKTAREAIKLIDTLTAKYGYFSTGESFSIADPEEVWIMDIHPKGVGNKGVVWAAVLVPNGYIAAHANQSRIRMANAEDTEYLMSNDAVSFAKSKNWYKEYKGKFSFADSYNPLDIGSVLFCEGRVWRFYSLAAPDQNISADYFRGVKDAEPYPLYIKPSNKIGVKDLQNWMRDHFEGTEFDMTKGIAAGPYGCPYRWKGLEWKLDGDTTTKYAWERPIGTQQTAFSFIVELRKDIPREIGGVMWYAVDAASTSCYVPLYCGINQCPNEFKAGSIAQFDWNSAFWVFNLVANRAYTSYKNIIQDIKSVQTKFEDKYLAYQSAFEKSAVDLYNQNPELAKQYLTDYSLSNTTNVVNEWRNLWEFVTVKYNDGYINDVTKNAGRTPKSAGYDKEFLKQVVKERPDYFQMKWRTKVSN